MQLKHHVASAFVVLVCASSFLGAQSYTVSQTGTFAPQNKKILLLQHPSGQKPIILFQTRLRVNTDGSPLSYHPQDLRGTRHGSQQHLQCRCREESRFERRICASRRLAKRSVSSSGFETQATRRSRTAFQITVGECPRNGQGSGQGCAVRVRIGRRSRAISAR